MPPSPRRSRSLVPPGGALQPPVLSGVSPRPRRPVLAAGVGLAAGLAVGGALGLLARRRRTIDLADRTALVTGGSRGLGLLIAEELVRQGTKVAILARDGNELAQAAERLRALGGEVLAIAADLRDPEAVASVVPRVVERFGGLDVLVNDAGVITVGPVETISEETFRETMDVHFWAPLRLARAARPHLARSGAGRIANVASIGGKVAVPHLAAYTASKFALVGLSKALAAELAKDGIAVTTVCPWLMRTGSFVHARFTGNRDGELAWFAASSSLPLLTWSGPRAARRIVAAIRRGDRDLTFGPGWLAARADALFPNLVAALLAIAERFLPRGDARTPRPGYLGGSRWVPSLLTRLGDRAAESHLELTGDAAVYGRR